MSEDLAKPNRRSGNVISDSGTNDRDPDIEADVRAVRPMCRLATTRSCPGVSWLAASSSIRQR